VSDGRHHVVGRHRVDDRQRSLVDGEVPCLACRVPGHVAGQYDLAGDPFAEVAKTRIVDRRPHVNPIISMAVGADQRQSTFTTSIGPDRPLRSALRGLDVR